jgi:post-segregation antitoxin (ccd killing protein)
MKTEVYSWRLSAELKSTLEQEARRRKISVSAALDTAVQEWIEHSRDNSGDEDQQQRLRSAALECVGSISSGNPSRAENARQLVRERLQRKRV